MKRQIWWVALVVVAVAGLVLTGVTSARSVDLTDGTVLGAEASRDVAETIWFQGYLADADLGDPVSGMYNMELRIFHAAAGGAAIWGPEMHFEVDISDGWFNVELGSIIGALPDFASPPYYVELTIEEEVLLPRLRLASVPTALRSGETDEDWIDEFWYPTDAGIGYADTVSIGMVAPWDEWGVLNIGPSEPDMPVIQHFVSPFAPQNGNGEGMPEGAILALFPWDPNFYVVNIQQDGWLWLGTDDYPMCAVTDSGKFIVSDYFGFGSPDRGLEPPGALTVDLEGVGAYSGAFYGNQDYEGAHVVHAEYYGDAPAGVAVYGDATVNDTWGIGGEFHGSMFGAVGIAESGGEGGEGGELIGVLGIADDYMETADYVYGIYGVDPSNGPRAIESYSGYFEGDVYVGGFLDYPIAASKIDHPLDPTNMTLSHASVESPDMMNVYNGNVVLDGAGEATVALPNYFEALNQDFRYQLTPIGAPGPNLYVASEIEGNSFRIAGGEAGMKVSWMVTGIRNDAYAQENRLVVEEPKVGRGVGRYLQPEAYNMPRTMSAEYREELETARAVAAAKNAEMSARQAERREQAKAASGTGSWMTP